MSKKVYVGSLPDNCKPESLRSLFESYGEITELDVMKNKNFGFVHFSNEESAQQAVDDLNDSTYEDKKIVVKISTGQKFNRDQRPPARGTPPTKVYVGNLPDGFRREALSDLFKEYGVLTEVDVIKNFGFIHFELEIDALKAIKEKNKSELEGKTLEVKISKSQATNRDNRPPPKADDRGRSSSTGGGGYDSSPRFHERRFNPLEAAGLLPLAVGGGGGRGGAANGSLSGMLAAAGVLNSLGGGGAVNSLPASMPRLSKDGTAGFVIYERYYVDTAHPLLKGLPIADLPRVSELQQRRSRVEDTSISGSAAVAPIKHDPAADMIGAPAHSAYQYNNSATDADMRDPYAQPSSASQRDYPLTTAALPRSDYAQSQENVAYTHLASRDNSRQAAPSTASSYELPTSLTWRDRSPTR